MHRTQSLLKMVSEKKEELLILPKETTASVSDDGDVDIDDGRYAMAGNRSVNPEDVVLTIGPVAIVGTQENKYTESARKEAVEIITTITFLTLWISHESKNYFWDISNDTLVAYDLDNVTTVSTGLIRFGGFEVFNPMPLNFTDIWFYQNTESFQSYDINVEIYETADFYVRKRSTRTPVLRTLLGVYTEPDPIYCRKGDLQIDGTVWSITDAGPLVHEWQDNTIDADFTISCSGSVGVARQSVWAPNIATAAYVISADGDQSGKVFGVGKSSAWTHSVVRPGTVDFIGSLPPPCHEDDTWTDALDLKVFEQELINGVAQVPTAMETLTSVVGGDFEPVMPAGLLGGTRTRTSIVLEEPLERWVVLGFKYWDYSINTDPEAYSFYIRKYSFDWDADSRKITLQDKGRMTNLENFLKERPQVASQTSAVIVAIQEGVIK